MQRALIAVASLLLLGTMPASAGQQPEQLHVSLSEDGKHLAVAWAVSLAYWAQYNPMIAWSTTGMPETLVRAQLVGAPPPETPGQQTFVYGAHIGPVPFGAIVSYRVGEPTLGWSPLTRVRMVPGPSEPISFAAYGDIGFGDVSSAQRAATGGQTPQALVRDLAIRQDPDLVLWLGDLAYANGDTGWNGFFREQEPLLSRYPVMPVIGNHDWQLEPREHARDHYEARFLLPRDESNYGFRAGPVYFIGLNSELPCSLYTEDDYRFTEPPCTYGRPNHELHAWLASELRRAQASGANWTVAFFHRAAYSWGAHGPNPVLQHFWVPLLERFGVDVVLQGHDHLYTRSHPIRNGTVATKEARWEQGAGTVYAVHGGGGRSLYELRPDPPEWYAAGRSVHGLMRVDASTTELRLRAFDSNGAEIDTFTIVARGADGNSDRGPGQDTPSVGLVLFLLALGAVVARRRRP